MLDHGAGLSGENSVGPGMLGLWYDPERLMIEGVYQDEVTAYRARRRWIEALGKNFLLEEALDFSLKVRRSRGGRSFRVRCDFLTACGRYAFWRLTHHQAPEVQFLLETAHLPHTVPSFSRVEDDFTLDTFAATEQGVDVGSQSSSQERNNELLGSVIQRVVSRLQGLVRRFSAMSKHSSEA